MVYDVIVVGGGIAGLTAAAYAAKAGYAPLLCEQQSVLGGLVRTFWRQGFAYDGGIRSIESSGIVRPMLRQLGLEIDLVPSLVSVGIEDQLVRIETGENLRDYGALLSRLYPANADEIAAIMREISRVMGYMDVLYGIDNPAFMDLTKDPVYLRKVILPWLLKYLVTVPKLARLNGPVVDHLRRFTHNQSLIDIIAQHFFQATPASFALSYFSLYLDYGYPRGGTGALPEALAAFIRAHGGTLRTDTPIVAVDPERRTVTAASGETYGYRQLIWAADLKTLYRQLDTDTVAGAPLREAIRDRRAALADKVGGDSILTVFLALDLDPSYFAERASAHLFYTPSREGQSQAGPPPRQGSRQELVAWLRRFLSLTTYEVSCPALRDRTLAPAGQTGLVVSLLFDHALTQRIEAQGWYAEFKALVEECMVATLDATIFPGLKAAVISQFSATPLTLARLTGNADGAITGWAFTNRHMPAERRMLGIAKAVRTPVPGILQAGLWTYSPSGRPISVLTGKLAADEAAKALGARLRQP